jgi:hypothetical protein
MPLTGLGWVGSDLAGVRLIRVARRMRTRATDTAVTRYCATGCGSIWAGVAARIRERAMLIAELKTLFTSLFPAPNGVNAGPCQNRAIALSIVNCYGRSAYQKPGDRQDETVCGRGGTGRRATLRSLWAKARGSSSLLGRTIFVRASGAGRSHPLSWLFAISSGGHSALRTLLGSVVVG